VHEKEFDRPIGAVPLTVKATSHTSWHRAKDFSIGGSQLGHGLGSDKVWIEWIVGDDRFRRFRWSIDLFEAIQANLCVTARWKEDLNWVVVTDLTLFVSRFDQRLVSPHQIGLPTEGAFGQVKLVSLRAIPLRVSVLAKLTSVTGITVRSRIAAKRVSALLVFRHVVVKIVL
jgi:hypothetical protein